MKIIMVDTQKKNENNRRFHNLHNALMFLYLVKYTYVRIYVTGLKQEYLKQYMNCGKEFQLVGVQ